MSEYILNLLPVTEEEKQEFESIAPQAVQTVNLMRLLPGPLSLL